MLSGDIGSSEELSGSVRYRCSSRRRDLERPLLVLRGEVELRATTRQAKRRAAGSEIAKLMHFDLAKMAASDAYKLVVSTVVPRPIALATTVDREGRVNAAPFSFFQCGEFGVPGRRARHQPRRKRRRRL